MKEKNKIAADPIIASVRACREERGRRFKHDIDAMFEDLRRMEEQSRAQGAIIVESPKQKKAAAVAHMPGSRKAGRRSGFRSIRATKTVG
jgi:hypothetical protein